MILTDAILIVFIIIFSVAGFWLSSHIYKKKRLKNHPFVCPLNGDCHAVVHSSYSSLLGVPLEILGFLYYGVIFIAYILFAAQVFDVVNISTLLESIHEPVFYLSIIAILVSVYLTFVQIFKLRQLCTWCLLSAGFCTAIVAASYLLFV